MSILKVVKGEHGVNKVHCLTQPGSQASVVYFGGDRIHQRGVDECILQLQDPAFVSPLLSAAFGQASVYVIEPSRREAGAACYTNFLVSTTLSGEPLGYRARGCRALGQLSSLLAGAGWGARDQTALHLVGFSKGGVVLNQVLTEVAGLAAGGVGDAAPGLPDLLHSVHYLDVGLNCRGAFLTARDTLAGLGAWAAPRPAFHLVLHTTPRTRGCKARPWLDAERTAMLALAPQVGLPCRHVAHFSEDHAQGADLLAMHFKVHLALSAGAGRAEGESAAAGRPEDKGKESTDGAGGAAGVGSVERQVSV